MKRTSSPTSKPKAQTVRARPASAGPTASAAEAAAKITPARAAAFEILTLVGENKGHSDELLHSARTDALSPEDRNLATALVMGVLRWQIALDARLSKLLTRPDQRLAEPVAIALRMGAFQLLHMDRIPAHAVLNESVELCRAAGQPHAAGMVNAILRKLAAAQKPSTRIFESPAAFTERLGHPLWLVERWVAAYGRDAALAICEYDQREPHSGILFPAPSANAAEPPATAAHPNHSVPQMDDGSRLVAELAAAAVPSSANPSRVWDCCAAPGGKTLILALRLPTADILATDVSAKRLAHTAARLRRYAYASRVRTEVVDASSTSATEPVTHFDLILCDVPCSGTGTLARNPEIRHRLRPEEFLRQAARQRDILLGAARRLAPGGRLLYSTCSLEPEENEQVIEAVALQAGLRVLPVEPLLSGLAAAGILSADSATTLTATAIRNGSLRTLPGVHPCDGFYAALLERN
ncbi:MAG TPA: transcription antitermination factor NusB [Acidobacteriaceae bacterium]